MASEHNRSRRNLLLAAGAASLVALGLLPSQAQASKYPRLDKACVDLRDAKKYLMNAPNIFGGHKKKAINALDSAIVEIELAIKYATANS